MRTITLFQKLEMSQMIEEKSSQVEHWSRESILDQVLPLLINKKGNKDSLKERVSVPFLDLAVVFYVRVAGDTIGFISQRIASTFRLSMEELYKGACSNMKHLVPVCRTVYEVLAGSAVKESVLSEVKNSPMELHVISVKENTYGACVLLDTEFLMTVAEKFGGSFVILPSSIHECLVSTHFKQCSKKELQRFVQTVNSIAVEPKEVLSGNPYFFDVDSKEVRIL